MLHRIFVEQFAVARPHLFAVSVFRPRNLFGAFGLSDDRSLAGRPLPLIRIRAIGFLPLLFGISNGGIRDGLVVSGNIDAPVLRWLRNTPRLRYVIVGNYDLPPGMPNVRMRIEAAVYRAMELCAQSRRRRIGVIINPAAKVAMREIMEGIAKAEAKGLVKKVGEVLDPQEDGYAGMLKLRKSGCNSVFVSEPAFFGLCRYIFEHRIKCPEELFIIRYGKDEEKDIYGDVAAITVTSDKTIMAGKIMSTLFSGGPALSEMDCEVTRN